MSKRQALRESFPACPKCKSRSVGVLLLTSYNVSIRCDGCDHRWTISNDSFAVVSADPNPVESPAG